METHTIQNVDAYNIHNEHSNTNTRAKKSLITDEIVTSNKAKNGKDTKSSSTTTQPSTAVVPLGITRIAYSVESDLNIVVARTIDTQTKKVLRQVPSEEAIRKMKLSKSYRPLPSIAKGLLLNNVVE